MKRVLSLGKPRKIPGWKFLLTFGNDLDIYQQGDMRKAVNRKTGKIVVEYNYKQREGKRRGSVV